MASQDRNEEFTNLTVTDSSTGTGGGSGSQRFADLRNGDVVAWSGQTYTNIDPTNTTNALGDARDHLLNNGGGGLIELATDIKQDTGDISGFTNMTIRGALDIGGAPTIEFTDLSANGFLVDGAPVDEQFTTIRNVRIDGSDLANRTGGSAIVFDSDVPQWELKGNIDFRNWIDPVVHTRTGHPFEAEWGTLYFQNYDGRCVYHTNGGEPWRIQHMTGGPENANDPTSGQQAFMVEVEYPGGEFEVGKMDMRANKYCPQSVRCRVSGNDIATFGTVDFESQVTQPDTVFFTQGLGKVWVGEVRVVGNDVGSSYELGGENPGNNDLGQPVVNDMTYGTGPVEITGDTGALNAYRGPRSDITNNSGTSPLSFEIECWGPNFSG
jgi:hypothetical protein